MIENEFPSKILGSFPQLWLQHSWKESLNVSRIVRVTYTLDRLIFITPIGVTENDYLYKMSS